MSNSREERSQAALAALAGELTDMDVPYSVEAFLSSGSYGIVCAGRDELTRQPVAVKRVYTTRSENKIMNILGDAFLARRVIREVRLLAHFHHPNILGLRDLMLLNQNSSNSNSSPGNPPPANPAGGDQRLYLVTELMNTDLAQVIQDSRVVLTKEYVQYYMYHVLLGLHCLHNAGVVHRDLHPANILLSADNDVKICDFNLAREDTPNDEKTYYVTHRWYRAPELVMQYRGFSKKVDVWSVGCIMAELYTRKPLFRGTTFYNQLNKIIEIVGTPAPEDYTFASKSASEYLQNSLAGIDKKPWGQVCGPSADDVAIDLLEKMLQFNPEKRISVEEALRHPFFIDYFDEADLTDSLSGPFHWNGEGMELPGLHQLLMEDANRFAQIRAQRVQEYRQRRAAGERNATQDGDSLIDKHGGSSQNLEDGAAAQQQAQQQGGMQLNAQSHLPRTGSFVSFD